MKDLWNLIFGPQGLILLGGIITLIGAFWSANRDLNSERELNEKNKVIIQKTEEIAGLNDKIVNVLTGGNSFPYVIFGIPDKKHGSPSLHLKGENAIQNVSGSFIDVRELRKDQRKGNLISNVGINFSKNIISPAYAQFVINERTYFDLSKGGRYMIHYYTPYNTFTQHLAIEPSTKDGFPLQAYQIYKGNNKELIYTSYPDNFPIPLEEIDFLEDLSEEELNKIKEMK